MDINLHHDRTVERMMVYGHSHGSDVYFRWGIPLCLRVAGRNQIHVLEQISAQMVFENRLPWRDLWETPQAPHR